MSKITELVLASRNKKKLKEFAAILSPLGITVKSVLEYPQVQEVEETGSSFRENAALKAESVARQIGGVVLADDSGLRVDSLAGEPGVYSSRYSGEGATDSSNNELLLQNLENVEEQDRGAEFVCVLALAGVDENTYFFEGSTRGKILREKRGEGGFGYDPLFLSDDLGVSFAEAAEEEKNSISHRARAVQKFLGWLEKSV